jgi:hypothetical protein
MELEKVEALIETICTRMGETYTGFHTISAGRVDSEPCPEICFHVGDPDNIENRLSGDGGMYYAAVGSQKTVVKDLKGKIVSEFSDLTKSNLM